MKTKADFNKRTINMLLNCRFDADSRKIYTGYYSGTGRFTRAHSAESYVKDVIDSFGYKYDVGNDAPRGGIRGEFIQLKTRKAFNTIADLVQARNHNV